MEGQLAFILTIFLVVSLGILSTYLTVRLIYTVSVYKRKRKIKKFNLSDFHIVDCYKGVPRTLQEKKNPNNLIYL